MKLHYIGFSDEWDEWCDCSCEPWNFAASGIFSNRKCPNSDLNVHKNFYVLMSLGCAQRPVLKWLQKNDFVDVNPCRHPSFKHLSTAWRVGRIEQVDRKSGQVMVGDLLSFRASNTNFFSGLIYTQEVMVAS